MNKLSGEEFGTLLVESHAHDFEPARTRPLKIPREPLEEVEGGFRFQFTVLGSADELRSRAYAADFLNMMPSAQFQGELVPGRREYAPTVAIGCASFADLVAHGRSAGDLHMIALDTGMGSETLEAAVIASIRRNPDLYVVEDLNGHQIPRSIVRTLWQGGFHFAACVCAAKPQDMFAAIIHGLAIRESEWEWLIDPRRPVIQVLFEGQRVTRDFREWVRRSM